MADKTPLTSEFNAWVEKLLGDWKVPGISLAVVDGEQVYSNGYGYSTLREAKVTADTPFYGGSVSKALTAATLAKLIDSKKYSELANGWATTISSILPDDFVLQDEWATNHLTLEDAASHRTGMPRHDKTSPHIIDGKQATPRDVVRNLRNLKLTAPPRVKFQYCNHMYVTLGHVIETVTGKPLDTVLREEIWTPLGMDSTYFSSNATLQRDSSVATGYYWDKDAEEHKVVPAMGLTEIAGAGAVVTTATDFAKWVKCLATQGSTFTEAVHQDIRAPRMIASTQPSRGNDISTYGLGWARTVYQGHALYNHSGGTSAFSSQAYWLPESQFGVVGFSNTVWSGSAVLDIIVWRLIADKLGIPEEKRTDIGASWTEIIKISLPVDATDQLFPNLPSPPLPSSFDVAELEGDYVCTGHGRLKLRVQDDPEKPGSKVLVADRDDMTWQDRMTLKHASGDFWVAYSTTPRNPTFAFEFSPAEFRRGHGGKVASLEVDWRSRFGGGEEGRASFKRTA